MEVGMTNEYIDKNAKVLRAHLPSLYCYFFDALTAQAKSNSILTRLDLIGELTSPEYISRLRGVMGEVVAFPAPDPLMAEAEGLGGISALAEHHAALTINPEFGAALWLDKRLVARIAADGGSSVVSADDPEPQWHKDAMVFVNAVNGLVASPVAGEVKG